MIQVANAPCSWGVLEFELEGEAAACGQVLDEMQQTGYAGTELGDWGFMPSDPQQLADELGQRDLQLLGAFVPVALANGDTHASGQEVARRTAQLMRDAGFPDAFIVLADDNGSDPTRTKYAGRIQANQGLSQADWTTFAKGADEVARTVKDSTGLRTVFHHHCAGYVETPDEIEELLKRTKAEQLGLVLDMGHLTFAGGDPVLALEQWCDRIWHIHYKDCHPGVAEQSRERGWDYFESVKHGVFCKLGEGEVDFPAITQALRDHCDDGWIVVEQDVLPGMGDPKSCAQHNRDYLKSLGL